MKISKSKQELARIISENGGWRDGAEFSALEERAGDVWFCKKRPKYKIGLGIFSFDDFIGAIDGRFEFANWHQTILSRDEYFHLYPAPDDSVNITVENNTALHISVTDKPTIEQLAADYRKAKDYAERKQQEADAAKEEAEAKLAELVAAGKALGLNLSVAAPEPELVITDWRDLRVGDIVWVDAYDDHDEGEWPVIQMEGASYDCDYAFSVKNGVSRERWISVRKPWRFIRRP